MKKPNITPRTWHVSSEIGIWSDDGDTKIAEVCDLPRIYVAGTMKPNLEQEAANAKALASLPDLLAALEGLYEECEQAKKDGFNLRLVNKTSEVTKSALIKAGYTF